MEGIMVNDAMRAINDFFEPEEANTVVFRNWI